MWPPERTQGKKLTPHDARVVPVRKLAINWREVCINPSRLRAMSGQEF